MQFEFCVYYLLIIMFLSFIRTYKMSKSKLKLIGALLGKLDRCQFEKYSRYGGRYDR